MIRWLGLLLLVAAGFAAFPGIDLAVSGYFFDGSTFPVQQNRLIEQVRLLLYGAENLGAAASLLAALWAGWRSRAVFGMWARDWAYGFAVFALGPGVLVNGVLKPLWGRARPDHITAFGGTAEFTPFWQISDQCTHNCSFTSGEASGSAALAILLGLLITANRTRLGPFYRPGLALTACIPLFTLWQRVAAGRHFLSDVVFGVLLVVLLAVALQPLRHGTRMA